MSRLRHFMESAATAAIIGTVGIIALQAADARTEALIAMGPPPAPPTTEAPPPTPPTTTTTTTIPRPVVTTAEVVWVTTTTTTLVPPDALCGQWWVTALAAGWSKDELPTLDRILYNESRCTNGLTSATNDIGLAQLNVSTWRHLWTGHGFTTEQVRDNPSLNLIYAKQVSLAAEAARWCKWQPWHGFSGDYC